MKTIFYNYALLIFLIILFGCSATKNTNSNTAISKELVESKRYTFIAQTVIPTEDSRYNPRFMFPNGSNLYQLTPGYDIKISPDSVTAYLPFFGRAYTAPMDPGKGGIKFTSTNFTYKITLRKKNYEVTITPKDVGDINSLFLSITPSGYAYAQVISINRSPIAYNGIIEGNQ